MLASTIYTLVLIFGSSICAVPTRVNKVECEPLFERSALDSNPTIKKPILVMDLDNTVYDCAKPKYSIKTYKKFLGNAIELSFPPAKEDKEKDDEDDDEEEDEDVFKCMLVLRPGIKNFLDSMVEYYDLAAFTMATKTFADRAISALKLDKYFPEDRRIYRENYPDMKGKDLSVFCVDLSQIILIDDQKDNFNANTMTITTAHGSTFKHGSNGIEITPFDANEYIDIVTAHPKFFFDYEDFDQSAFELFDFLKYALREAAEKRIDLRKVVFGYHKHIFDYQLGRLNDKIVSLKFDK